MNNPIVTIEMENGKKITAELYPDIAPQSVRNFISLANSGFYNGLIFHRCIYGFMIQGGCPDGTGMGGPGYCIKGEFAANGVPNDLRHTRGVLSMARAQDMDSAGSQFFIMHKDAPHLDGQYAAFGMVIDGTEESERHIREMLFWDVNNGIARRSWARNEGAMSAIRREMERTPGLQVTMPNIADEELVRNALKEE